MDPKLLGPLLFVGVVLLLMYQRVRRSFGRQAVSTSRLSVRAGVLCILGAMLAFAMWRQSLLVEALGAGILGGALLGLVGLRYTRFEATEQGRFYTPHTYIGVLVLALFVGRLVYRLAVQTTLAPGHYGGTGAHPLAIYEHNPLTLTVVGLPIGYYTLYNLGVLRKSRALAQPPGTTPL